MVLMTCCNRRYGTVAETLDHTCPIKDGSGKSSLPIVATECQETTVHMERHGAHMYPDIDQYGNAVRFSYSGF